MSLRRLLLSLVVLVAVSGCGDDGTEPRLAAAAPDSGGVGTGVLLTGGDFEGGMSARFSGLEALGTEVRSSGEAVAYAPTGIVLGGVYDIEVTNPGGKSSKLENAFRAVGPRLAVVNGVSKPSGIPGSPVILEGAAFGDRLGYGSVWFTGPSGPLEADVVLEDNWTDGFVVATVPATAVSGPVWVETSLGTSNSIEFRVTEQGSFSPSEIFWTQTGSLPAPSQGHGAVFLESVDEPGIDNLIYLTGGADGSLVPRTSVHRTAIDGVGGIGAWTPLADLPDERAFHGCVLATPYNALIDTTVAGHLYVVGGIDSSGTAKRTVFRAPVNLDRSLGGWLETSPLPDSLHSMGVTIFRSWMYVAGGASGGDEPRSAVYRARILPDGSLGPWEGQLSLPEGRAYTRLTQFAGVLYVLGGAVQAVPPEQATVGGANTSSIVLHRLDLRTGELRNTWASTSSLIKAVAKHTAVVAGGTILSSGGVYNGAGNSATEHQYATIQPDGTVGSFGGATGSQTVESQGGKPFFNHATVVYVDASGAARVIILGGNDINDPATPVADCWYY